MKRSFVKDNHSLKCLKYPNYLKSQIPSTKLQINLKLQITNSKPVQRAAQVFAPRERLFFLGDFEFPSLLFICFLGFVIWNFNKSMTF
jgi:hypothetical protein